MGKIIAMSFLKIRKSKMSEFLEELNQISMVKKIYPLSSKFNMLVEMEIDSVDEFFEKWTRFANKSEIILKADTQFVMRKLTF